MIAYLRASLTARLRRLRRPSAPNPTGPAAHDYDPTAILTGTGGPFEQPAEIRELLALRGDGTLYVSPAHRSDMRILSLIDFWKRIGFPVRDIIEVTLSQISELYQTTGGSTRQLSEAEQRTKVKTLIEHFGKLRVKDVHVDVTNRTIVRYTKNEQTKIHEEWTAAEGHAFLRAAFALSQVSDSTYKANRDQSAQIVPTDTPIPDILTGIRLQFVPLANDGRMLTMRFLYRGSILDGRSFTIQTLGFYPQHEEPLRRIRNIPFGLVLVVGPTGSGKSTLLELLFALKATESGGRRKQIAIQDPPEADMPGTSVVPVTNVDTEEQRDAAYSDAIRASLRSAPKDMYVGEIRDIASARLCFRSAMTGHPTYTTLHANHSFEAPGRLEEEGLQPYLLYDHKILRGIVYTRLARTLCSHCSQPVDQNAVPVSVLDLVEIMSIQQASFRKAGPGCKHCDEGYAGITAIGEVVNTDRHIMELLREHRKLEARQYWLSLPGSYSITEHAAHKAASGYISCDEMLDVLGEEEISEDVGLLRDRSRP